MAWALTIPMPFSASEISAAVAVLIFTGLAKVIDEKVIAAIAAIILIFFMIISL
jgi:putative Ca2+/H+ antiporter (TMEM165/GDT1 family)